MTTILLEPRKALNKAFLKISRQNVDMQVLEQEIVVMVYELFSLSEENIKVLEEIKIPKN